MLIRTRCEHMIEDVWMLLLDQREWMALKISFHEKYSNFMNWSGKCALNHTFLTYLNSNDTYRSVASKAKSITMLWLSDEKIVSQLAKAIWLFGWFTLKSNKKWHATFSTRNVTFVDWSSGVQSRSCWWSYFVDNEFYCLMSTILVFIHCQCHTYHQHTFHGVCSLCI